MDRKGSTLACTLLALALLAGCQKKEETPPAAGPAEQAGRKLDQAAAQIKPELEKLGDKAGQALKDAGQTLQQKAREGREQDQQKDQGNK